MLLSFAKGATNLSGSRRSTIDQEEVTVQQKVFVFVEKVGKPFVNDLMMWIEKAMKETLPVLCTFKIFNPSNVNKSTAQKIS